jgi:hypothetical protein
MPVPTPEAAARTVHFDVLAGDAAPGDDRQACVA